MCLPSCPRRRRRVDEQPIAAGEGARRRISRPAGTGGVGRWLRGAGMTCPHHLFSSLNVVQKTARVRLHRGGSRTFTSSQSAPIATFDKWFVQLSLGSRPLGADQWPSSPPPPLPHYAAAMTPNTQPTSSG